MSEIVWEDPPLRGGRGRGYGRVQQFVEQLKTRPGAWAKWPEPRKNGIAAANKQRFPGTDWTQRSRPDGQFDMYARWVGDEDIA